MLKIGDKAPQKLGKDENGKEINLEKFLGKKVILFFYPKDDTPGCTKEACNFRDNYKMLKKKKMVVIGISCDPPKKHLKFIEKFELPFPLIADEEQVLVKEYGVWGLKKFMGREYMGILRTTFVIDEQGIIEKIITSVDTENSTAQILT